MRKPWIVEELSSELDFPGPTSEVNRLDRFTRLHDCRHRGYRSIEFLAGPQKWNKTYASLPKQQAMPADHLQQPESCPTRKEPSRR